MRGTKRSRIEFGNSRFSAIWSIPRLSSSSSASVEFPGAGWQTAAPDEVGMDPVRFAAAMETLPSPSVVIRNGRIVTHALSVEHVGKVPNLDWLTQIQVVLPEALTNAGEIFVSVGFVEFGALAPASALDHLKSALACRCYVTTSLRP